MGEGVETQLAGGCLCGAIRYAATAAPSESGYCHCRLCQRSSGAPVNAWMSFGAEDFRFTEGQPKVFRSSDHGQREFCLDCGTPLLYRDDDGFVSVNIATLDDPRAVAPDHHIWRESRLPWFETADSLARYPEFKPQED